MHASIFRKILLISLFFSSFCFLLSITSNEIEEQTVWALDTIESKHYLSPKIKDLEKDAILINFAKAIDPQKMYFIEKDINDLLFRFSNSTKYFLEKGNLYPAYEAYELYKDKVKQRTDWICEYLDSSFSFTNPNFFYSDRTESNWPLDELEANALWTRFLKHQLLNELLSVSSDETSFEDSPIAHVKATNILLHQLLNDSVFYEKKLNEAKNKIKRRYSRNLKALDSREASDIQEAFINSITNLFDPHSAFLSSHSLEEFQTQVKNSFVGIGAVLEDVDGICTIKEILPGGPAERSKELNPEDEIHGVAQGEGPIEDVVDMNLKYIVRKIKGAKGTTVRLEINPGGVSNSASKKTISLIRDEIKITENLASAKIIKIPHKENSLILIGVISLPSFYGHMGPGANRALSSTAKDVEELVEMLKEEGVKGIILDLRNNGGGLLSEAVKLTDLFIKTGPVVQIADSKSNSRVEFATDPSCAWNGPLSVLTNSFSASASEIVAGALKDHQRALIIGDSSTHGKGTVQEMQYMKSLFPFWVNKNKDSNNVASKITIKQFFLPKGSSTQIKGVESNIVIPSNLEFLKIGESSLENAVPWKKIQPYNWKTNWLEEKISSLKDPLIVSHLLSLSSFRQNSLEEFNYLTKSIALNKEAYEKKKVSLNLETRIYEQIEKNKARAILESDFNLIKETERYTHKDLFLKKIGAIKKEDAIISEKNEVVEPPSFDIPLREASRIMSDWVAYSE